MMYFCNVYEDIAFDHDTNISNVENKFLSVLTYSMLKQSSTTHKNIICTHGKCYN